ncbi:MAG: hypothetical protein QM817_33870 [Archangium sp.]
MLQPLMLVVALSSSSSPAPQFSLAAGAHLSEAGLAAVLFANVDVDAKLDSDEFYRLEFRASGRGVSSKTSSTVDVLVAMRMAFAYVSVGLATQLHPYLTPTRTELDFASGPSVGVRLVDRDDLLLRVAFSWLPLGTNFTPSRTIAEVWGAWRFLGVQLTGAPLIFGETVTSRAFFSAAFCVRVQT